MSPLPSVDCQGHDVIVLDGPHTENFGRCEAFDCDPSHPANHCFTLLTVVTWSAGERRPACVDFEDGRCRNCHSVA